MMSNYKIDLIKLNEVPDETPFWQGAKFREFGVGRLGLSTPEEDYYDLILVDSSLLKPDTFILINGTLESHHFGSIISILENVQTKYFIKASVLKEYYVNNDNIFFMETE